MNNNKRTTTYKRRGSTAGAAATNASSSGMWRTGTSTQSFSAGDVSAKDSNAENLSGTWSLSTFFKRTSKAAAPNDENAVPNAQSLSRSRARATLSSPGGGGDIKVVPKTSLKRTTSENPTEARASSQANLSAPRRILADKTNSQDPLTRGPASKPWQETSSKFKPSATSKLFQVYNDSKTSISSPPLVVQKLFASEDSSVRASATMLRTSHTTTLVRADDSSLPNATREHSLNIQSLPSTGPLQQAQTNQLQKLAATSYPTNARASVTIRQRQTLAVAPELSPIPEGGSDEEWSPASRKRSLVWNIFKGNVPSQFFESTPKKIDCYDSESDSCAPAMMEEDANHDYTTGECDATNESLSHDNVMSPVERNVASPKFEHLHINHVVDMSDDTRFNPFGLLTRSSSPDLCESSPQQAVTVEPQVESELTLNTTVLFPIQNSDELRHKSPTRAVEVLTPMDVESEIVRECLMNDSPKANTTVQSPILSSPLIASKLERDPFQVTAESPSMFRIASLRRPTKVVAEDFNEDELPYVPQSSPAESAASQHEEENSISEGNVQVEENQMPNDDWWWDVEPAPYSRNVIPVFTTNTPLPITEAQEWMNF